jgi:hypothetical protein
MYNQNKENENEAHLQVGQNYTGNKSFWAEIDGADVGFFQMNWNSAHVAADSHDSYSKDTTAHAWFGNGAIYYASANHALTAGGGYDNESKIWQLGSRRLRFWNTEGTQLAEFGSARMDINDIDHSARYQFDFIDNLPRMRIDSSADKVDITPDYINFYDSAWNLDATINKGQISAWNELIGSTPSRVVASTADATGSNILYIVTGS